MLNITKKKILKKMFELLLNDKKIMEDMVSKNIDTNRLAMYFNKNLVYIGLNTDYQFHRKNYKNLNNVFIINIDKCQLSNGIMLSTYYVFLKLLVYTIISEDENDTKLSTNFNRVLYSINKYKDNINSPMSISDILGIRLFMETFHIIDESEFNSINDQLNEIDDILYNNKDKDIDTDKLMKTIDKIKSTMNEIINKKRGIK